MNCFHESIEEQRQSLEALGAYIQRLAGLRQNENSQNLLLNAHFTRAERAILLGEGEIAKQDLYWLQEHMPQTEENKLLINLMLGCSAQLEENHLQAIPYWEEVELIYQSLPDQGRYQEGYALMLLHRAISHARCEHYEKAIADCDAFELLQGGSAFLFIIRASAYWYSGNQEKTEEDIALAHQYPLDANVSYRLVCLYQSMNRPREALDVIDKALRTHMDDDRFHLKRSEITIQLFFSLLR